MNKKEAQIRLTSIETEVKELRKIIEAPEVDKTKEMSDFLFSILSKTEVRITGEKEITHYKIGTNEWLIQQDYKNGKLWVRNIIIWEVFESKYKLNYGQIRDFIQGWIEANTGWEGLTPLYCPQKIGVKIEANTGWEGLTPQNK